MKMKVVWVFVSEQFNDCRRISVEIQDYPVKPNIGESVALPVAPAGRPSGIIFGKVRDVAHDPMGTYFKDQGCRIDCTVEVDHDHFITTYNFLEKRRKEVGPTHQWLNWRIFKV